MEHAECRNGDQNWRDYVTPVNDVTVYVINAKEMRACPHVKVKFRDSAVKAVIDTGSHASIIAEETYQLLAAGGIKIAVLPVASTVLTSAFGTKTSRIRIQAMIIFTIGGSTFENIFPVTHQLRNQCILGWDFLYHYKFSINVERGACRKQT
jgi:hypothetical protein